MKEQKLKICIVIYTIVNERKNYIAADRAAENNQRWPYHHRDINQAMPFLTQKEAQTYLSNIFNFHSRKYEVEKARIPVKTKPILSMQLQ